MASRSAPAGRESERGAVEEDRPHAVVELDDVLVLDLAQAGDRHVAGEGDEVVAGPGDGEPVDVRARGQPGVRRVEAVVEGRAVEAVHVGVVGVAQAGHGDGRVGGEQQLVCRRWRGGLDDDGHCRLVEEDTRGSAHREREDTAGRSAVRGHREACGPGASGDRGRRDHRAALTRRQSGDRHVDVAGEPVDRTHGLWKVARRSAATVAEAGLTPRTKSGLGCGRAA